MQNVVLAHLRRLPNGCENGGIVIECVSAKMLLNVRKAFELNDIIMNNYRRSATLAGAKGRTVVTVALVVVVSALSMHSFQQRNILWRINAWNDGECQNING